MNFTRDTVRNGNICLIWIDDMIDIFSWRTAFGVTIQTPNIDRLMGEGIRFANAYATIPLCAPCRAEVATGLSPFVTGLVDLNRFWRDALPATASWVYDLRRAGFHTFTTGKTDANYNPMPEAFRRVLFHEDVPALERGKRRGVHSYLERGPGIAGVNHPNDDGSCDHTFYDHSVAQNAMDFLDRADPARRHLIQLGFKHPHYNLTCPDRFYQMYDPAQITWPTTAHPDDYHGPQPGMAVYEMAYIVNGTWTPEKAGDEAWRQVVRAYFAACSHVDYEIGRFMDKLRSSALGQNTTVILVSDNGFNLGTHDSFHKMSQWDSAAHVPLGLWHGRIAAGQAASAGQERRVDCPVSLHNLPKTIIDLAGLLPRADWVSGQSLLPLIDDSFGDYDRDQSPLTAVFGTLSIRPSVPGYEHLRYFRYPNGEEHIYDVERDPGETTNLAGSASSAGDLVFLRAELIRAAARLGLDLSGMEDPENGLNALMAMDGTLALQGPPADSHFWAYGQAADQIIAAPGANHVLWYLGGPKSHVLRLPPGIATLRIGTVRARDEDPDEDGSHASRSIEVVAHPESGILFEASERVAVHVKGSDQGDRMYGPVYAGAVFEGGSGDDLLVAVSSRRNDEHRFYGGAGNDTLIGNAGRATLDGGPGDDLIIGGTGFNLIFGGFGNDTITDGDRRSVIHTGPGYNSVTAGEGNHVFHIGPGENRVTGGPGGVTYHIAWGGVCRITDWRKEDRILLEDWPGTPVISVEGGDTLISLGLSVVVLEGVGEAGLLPETLLAPDGDAEKRGGKRRGDKGKDSRDKDRRKTDGQNKGGAATSRERDGGGAVEE